jgi:hypothetical protein
VRTLYDCGFLGDGRSGRATLTSSRRIKKKKD